jgi:hypothetical protein
VKCTLSLCRSSLISGKLKITRFAWNFHRSDEATNYVTSYRYDTTRTEEKDPTVLELFDQALDVREYPDDATEISEHPFRGLINAARTSAELHNNLICVSFRVPPRDDRESESELKALRSTGVAFHFPFVVAKSYTINHNYDLMIDGAAEKLASWFRGNLGQLEQYECEADASSEATSRRI